MLARFGCVLSNIFDQNTSLSFDGNDIDDKAVIAMGEMVPRMLAEREKYNAEHPTEQIVTVSKCVRLIDPAKFLPRKLASPRVEYLPKLESARYRSMD
jgi:hypothetical protein